MTPPPDPQWGQSPSPRLPPTAWAPKPPSPTAALDSELQTWLVVTCVGWFVGLMWITGPLGWWKANELRSRYATLGAPEPSNVTVMRIIGILTTVICLLVFAAVCLVVTIVVGFGFRVPLA